MGSCGGAVISAVFAVSISGARAETVMNPVPPYHVHQNSLYRLGWRGWIDCGPAAVTESLAFLKWTREPNFPNLKWGVDTPSEDAVYGQTRQLRERFQTSPWQLPFFNPLYTDSVDIVKGLRQYFKDSGYANPWVFAKGYRAFDAPEGRSVAEMQEPVTLSEIREYVRKGFGVVILTGYYNRWGRHKRRNGGHYLSVFGYKYDPQWADSRTDLIVTDSLRTSEEQPRVLKLTPIEKNPLRSYPAHVAYKIDGDDTAYVDAAIFFLPEM